MVEQQNLHVDEQLSEAPVLVSVVVAVVVVDGHDL